MPRTITRPQGLDLDSPGRRDYLLALEHDSVWGEHLIPLTVIVGRDHQAKPDDATGLVAFASTHGNEYEGPVAVKHLLRTINTDDVTGRLILIPVLNPGAFKAGTRTSGEDGVNLNRAFLNDAGKHPALASISFRIAAFVREYIWPRVHVVLDLHSANTLYQFAHTTSYHPVDNADQTRAIEQTARAFGTPFVMTYQNETPGLLTSEAERLGKITVGTELGHGSGVDPAGVRYATAGVRNAAIQHGIMTGDITPIAHQADDTQQRVAIVDRDCYTTAPRSGHYEPLFNVGDTIKAGQTAGYLHDFDRIDEEPLSIVAQIDGVILVQAYYAPVPQGMHILVVAKVEPFAA